MRVDALDLEEVLVLVWFPIGLKSKLLQEEEEMQFQLKIGPMMRWSFRKGCKLT